MASSRKVFSIVAHTAPTAEEGRHQAEPAPITPPMSRRQDVPTPASAEPPARIAFTWRLTVDEADRLDDLVRRLRRQLNRRRLDKAAVLLALVQTAEDHDDVRAAVLAKLRQADAETS